MKLSEGVLIVVVRTHMNRVQLRLGSGPKDEMASLNSATLPSRLWHDESVMGGLRWQSPVNPALIQ